MNIKLTRSLTMFVRIVETNSMSLAAKQLGMTTSAVSQQIKTLEQEVGLNLFNRSPRSLSLTEAGDIYYQSCKKLLQTAEQTKQKLQYLTGIPSGKLKLVAPVGFGAGLLSEPLKRLIELHLKLNIELILTDEPIDMLKEGADLALCIGPLNDSNLIARKLAQWPYALCVSATHPLAKNGQCIEQLNQYAHIAHSHLNYQLFKPNSAPYTLNAPRIKVNNMQSVIQLVCDGLGYAMLPEPEVRERIKNKELKQLYKDWQRSNYTVYAVTPKRDFIAAKTYALLDILKKHFAGVSLGTKQHL